MENDRGYEGWAIVELMGHRRLAGKVSEAVVAGAAMLRIDIPMEDGNVTTQFYGGSAIYALTPTNEELAREVAALSRPEPVGAWELPRRRQLAAGDVSESDFENEEEG